MLRSCSRKLKFDRFVLATIEANNKDTSADLWDTKVKSVQLTFEDAKSRKCKEILKFSEKCIVLAVTESQNVFENEKVDTESPVKFSQNACISTWKQSPWIIGPFGTIAARKGLTWRPPNYSNRLGLFR
jgi:hypothetical protein